MSLVTMGMGEQGNPLTLGLGGGILTIIYRKVMNLISWIGNQL